MRTAGTTVVCMYRSASFHASGVWGSFTGGRVVSGVAVGVIPGVVAGWVGSLAGRFGIGSVIGGSLAGRSGISSVAGRSGYGSVSGGSLVGRSEFGSVAAEDVLAVELVASGVGFWTDTFLQVTLVRKWVSRRLNLPPHLVHISFCFLVAFLERVFCDRRWSYSLPCLSVQYLR